MPRVDSEVLRSFASEVTEAFGAPPAIASAVATSLVSADLRGHGSHGVIRLATTYREMIDGEQLSPAATPRVVSENDRNGESNGDGGGNDRSSDGEPTVLVDGGRGFGQVAGRFATDVLTGRAAAHGIGAVGILDASHLGRVGEFAERVADAGHLFTAWVNTGGTASLVAPVGRSDRRLATNPLAFGVPSFGVLPFPIVLDMATSQVAHGKITKRAIEGESLPPDWAIDDEGDSITDAEVFEAGTGAMAPLGGRVAGHKGFGLAVVAELFAGICADGRVAGERAPETVNNSALFVAIDPDRFGSAERNRERIGALVSFLDGANERPNLVPESARGDRQLLPGEAEHRTAMERREQGIPIDERTAGALTDVAAAYGVDVPQDLES